VAIDAIMLISRQRAADRLANLFGDRLISSCSATASKEARTRGRYRSGLCKGFPVSQPTSRISPRRRLRSPRCGCSDRRRASRRKRCDQLTPDHPFKTRPKWVLFADVRSAGLHGQIASAARSAVTRKPICPALRWAAATLWTRKAKRADFAVQAEEGLRTG